MRAIVAKRIRKQVYGKGLHPGPIQYFRRGVKFGGAIVADKARQDYQLAKKAHYANPNS